MRRRDFLWAGLLGAIAAPAMARALGPAQSVRLPQLVHNGRWQVHPGALTYLAAETGLRTSVAMHPDATTVSPFAPELHDSMILFVTGTGTFSWTPEERLRIERWLGLGGLMVFDNAGVTGPDADFDASIRRELKAIFPQAPIERVSPEHVIFRSFYRLDYPSGRALHKPFIEGIRVGSRFCVFVLHNDLLGAMATNDGRTFLHTPTPGGENQREMAIRFGVNLVMYATCLHYKDDQVHVDYLLHKRKWKIRRPQ
jgi:hypothetical protein